MSSSLGPCLATPHTQVWTRLHLFSAYTTRLTYPAGIFFFGFGRSSMDLECMIKSYIISPSTFFNSLWSVWTSTDAFSCLSPRTFPGWRKSSKGSRGPGGGWSRKDPLTSCLGGPVTAPRSIHSALCSPLHTTYFKGGSITPVLWPIYYSLYSLI